MIAPHRSADSDDSLLVGPGAAPSALRAHADLVDTIRRELLQLRKSHGSLTIQKFAQHETLRRACGGDDLLDAYAMFRREMTRFQTQGRIEAAAALSIIAEADTVLDRLQVTAEALSPDEWRDQRTARRWSDAGMPILAEHLAYLAEVQGRLGRELLNLLVEGDANVGIRLTVDQMTHKELDSRAPEVRIWRSPEEDIPQEITLSLEKFQSTSVEQDLYMMRRHVLHIDMPDATTMDPETAVLAVTITGQDAPMRTVIMEDQSQLHPHFRIRWATYRTIATMTIEAMP